MTTTQKVLWTPSEDFVANSNLKAYEAWLSTNKGLTFHDYKHLWQWSIEDTEAFWESIWEYFQVKSYSPYKAVLTKDKMPDAQWFIGATLNYTEHLFRKKTTDRPALIFQNEAECLSLSWRALEERVIAVQQYLKKIGIKKGDRVAGYLPNIPEAIICFMAANSIGAVWSCCSPDFGEATVIERFAQIAPKVLIATDGYSYGGKAFNRNNSIEAIRTQVSSITHTLYIPYQNKQATLDEATYWQDIQAAVTKDQTLEFDAVPFDHPIWVLYSSGTTGKPKAITHSHGGVLLEHLKYMALHNDVKEGEHFFWFSTTGWMMWNFLQSSLLAGAVPVLFDGSPAHPSMEVLWKLTQDLPIHHFGTSAPFLTACMKQGLKLNEQFDFSELRSIGSTGAPLPPEVFEYIYEHISPSVWLCSMSGGTDVCTAFVGGNPYLPVYKGYIQSRALGCAMKAYSEEGHELIGELGEMVIEKPMPSMPIYFWNDKQKKRYLASYFDDYPGMWRHGDYIQIEANGSLIIQGRSDATLNRNGVRIGTAEIYSVLDKMPALEDSLILNLEKADGDDVLPLFVVMKKDMHCDEALKKDLVSALRKQCSPRHVPTEIIEVPDIPYTLSGKKMEVPIKKLLMGLKQAKDISRDAIRNPAAMDHFVQLVDKFQAKTT